jgi:hypothetical protein
VLFVVPTFANNFSFLHLTADAENNLKFDSNVMISPSKGKMAGKFDSPVVRKSIKCYRADTITSQRKSAVSLLRKTLGSEESYEELKQEVANPDELSHIFWFWILLTRGFEVKTDSSKVMWLTSDANETPCLCVATEKVYKPSLKGDDANGVTTMPLYTVTSVVVNKPNSISIVGQGHTLDLDVPTGSEKMLLSLFDKLFRVVDVVEQNLVNKQHAPALESFKSPTSPLQIKSKHPKANKRTMNWMKNQLRRFKGAGLKTREFEKAANANAGQTVVI